VSFPARLLAGFLCLAAPALSQTPLTLADAEARLVEQNLSVIAARRGVDAARAQRLVAGSLPPPDVLVGSGVGQFTEARKTGPQGLRGTGPGRDLTVGLSVLVERGGKRTLRSLIADRQIDAAEAQVVDTLRTQLAALRQVFIAGLLARENLDVALANRGSLDRTEGLLRRQLRDGAIPEGDLLRFQASRLPFEADVTNNRQTYAAAVATVASLLSVDASGAPPFDLRGRLAAGELGISREALAAGIATRPDVVAAARQAEAAQRSRELAEAARSRDVSVVGTYTRSGLSQDLPDSRNRLQAVDQLGVSLSVPIFTRRIVEGNVGVATAQQAQAELAARAALLGAQSDFAAAWAGYEQARALAALYDGGALNRAEAAYRSTEQAWQAGGRSLLDVLDAARTLNATRVAGNQARAAVLQALVQLELASGVAGVVPRQ